jgi:septal ring factor EnvC (AmiA/AmiB activator)
MWPKAISQLIELAPHAARLLPMADRFFQSKTADAEASRTAMEQMAEGLRGDLGQVTASHAGLYRQLNEQSEKLTTLSSDLHSTKLSVDSADARLTRIEARISTAFIAIALGFAMLMIICVLLVVILLHLHPAS